MIIEVGEDYRVTTDPLNWIVEERHVATAKSKTPGTVTWKPVAYCSSLYRAIEVLFAREVRRVDAEGLVAVLDAIEALEAKLIVRAASVQEGE